MGAWTWGIQGFVHAATKKAPLTSIRAESAWVTAWTQRRLARLMAQRVFPTCE